MITRLWNWLFYACKHEWEIKDEHQIHFITSPIGKQYISQCKKCGILKKDIFKC